MCTPAQLAILRRVYPRGTWAEIEAAFPGYSRETILAWASRNRVARVHRDRATKGLDPIVVALIQARRDRDIQPKVLAAKLGVSLNAVYEWERGRHAPRDFRTLRAWANTVGLTIKLEPLP